MRIEDYFEQLRSTIGSCPVVLASDIRFDARDSNTGFVRGILYIVDGSILHLREFVDVELRNDRLMYSYQYMNVAKQLIFRYDNTQHHVHLNLPTHPHHKHAGSENTIVASAAPTLDAVLAEVELMVSLA